jgi:prepilin-type N-terminal cleavage/methylation domain-containing protein
MNDKFKKGFTLVELLVVIGILAILTAAVVVVLNPAELLKQARDAQRLSDFDALRSAIALYLSTAPTPTFNIATSSVAFAMVGSTCHGMSANVSCSTRTSTAIDGNGWVPINFKELENIGLSSPLSSLPRDPINNVTYYYAGAFEQANKYYELDTVLESNKYNIRMQTDGGNNNSVYEVGTKPGLNW